MLLPTRRVQLAAAAKRSTLTHWGKKISGWRKVRPPPPVGRPATACARGPRPSSAAESAGPRALLSRPWLHCDTYDATSYLCTYCVVLVLVRRRRRAGSSCIATRTVTIQFSWPEVRVWRTRGRIHRSCYWPICILLLFLSLPLLLLLLL